MIKLYFYPGACSLAPQIALLEAGIEHEVEYVDILAERPAFRQLNPSGKVPVLRVDGTVLTENVAILSYIATLHPERRLLPEEPMALAQALSLLAWFSNTAHIARRQNRRPAAFTADTATHAALSASGRDAQWASLVRMDALLADRKWFGGDTFSVCDCYGMVFHQWGLTDGIPVDQLESLSRFGQAMLDRPSVRTVLERERTMSSH